MHRDAVGALRGGDSWRVTQFYYGSHIVEMSQHERVVRTLHDLTVVNSI